MSFVSVDLSACSRKSCRLAWRGAAAIISWSRKRGCTGLSADAVDLVSLRLGAIDEGRARDVFLEVLGADWRRLPNWRKLLAAGGDRAGATPVAARHRSRQGAALSRRAPDISNALMGVQTEVLYAESHSKRHALPVQCRSNCRTAHRSGTSAADRALEMTASWLRDEVSGLSAAQLAFRGAPAQWTILEVLDHLVVVGPSTGKICRTR